jgi:hypothetical protein
MQMDEFREMVDLSKWIVKLIGTNKSIAFTNDKVVDWNWIASEIWNAYPGILNEFLINDCIDFLMDTANEARNRQS